MANSEQLWNPFAESNFTDPYSMYKRLREQDPVYKAQTGEWIVTSYKEVKSVLSSRQFLVGNRLEWIQRSVSYLRTRGQDLDSITEAMNSFLLFQNPPQHEQSRKALLEIWNHRDVETQIEASIVAILEKIDDQKFDLVAEFSQKLPALTISKLLGVPLEDYLELKSWAVQLIKALDLYISVADLVRIDKVSTAFIAYFSKLIDEKQNTTDESLVSKLLRSPSGLSKSQLISTCIFLFVAGEETTSGTISTGIYNLCKNPDQMELLRANPQKTSMAVNELLRFDSPVHLLGRIASEPVKLRGKEINVGDTLTVCLGSANRDETVFVDPDTLNVQRQPNPHLAFGAGTHYCLGDWLGKMQTEIAIKHLLSRFKNITLIDSQPEWNNHLSIRSLKALWLSCS